MDDRGYRAHWAPVVYGRTRQVDRWWRALPRDVERSWLEAPVMGVVAGGRRLVEGPRFLLARGHTHLLVGVACRARLLSDSMHSDGSRELYCFVGWSACQEDGAYPPPLAWLADGYRRWAAPVYQQWMELDWNRSARDLNRPHETEPGAAPWDASPAPQGRANPDIVELSAVWPSRDAPKLWEQIRMATRPVNISVGWRVASDALTDDAAGPLHVAADDIQEPREVRLPQRPAARRSTPAPPMQQSGPAPAYAPREPKRPDREGRRDEHHRSESWGKKFLHSARKALTGDEDFVEIDDQRTPYQRKPPEHSSYDRGPSSVPQRRDPFDDAEHDYPPRSKPPAARPTYRPPIVPPSNTPNRAAKVDAAFTFDQPGTPAESPRHTLPDEPRPLDPTPSDERLSTTPLGPIAVEPEATPSLVEREAPARARLMPDNKPSPGAAPTQPVPEVVCETPDPAASMTTAPSLDSATAETRMTERAPDEASLSTNPIVTGDGDLGADTEAGERDSDHADVGPGSAEPRAPVDGAAEDRPGPTEPGADRQTGDAHEEP